MNVVLELSLVEESTQTQNACFVILLKVALVLRPFHEKKGLNFSLQNTHSRSFFWKDLQTQIPMEPTLVVTYYCVTNCPHT